MRSIKVSEHDAGQRLDKYLLKYLPKASKGFIYKMLRKKNIKLNKGRATGSEKLVAFDIIELFLSEETIASFSDGTSDKRMDLPDIAYNEDKGYIRYGRYTIDIIYEDNDIIILNKPAGLLSQKSVISDVSLVDVLEAYVNKSAGDGHASSIQKPGIVSRLDRNTSGLVACGKTLRGLQELSEAVRERRVEKTYRCIVNGRLMQGGRLTGYLVKDEHTNKVSLVQKSSSAVCDRADYIETEYDIIENYDNSTYLSVKLITGKTHQIRAHLSGIGHPVAGDIKYGARKEAGLNHFLLHSYSLKFGNEKGGLSRVANMSFTAPVPNDIERYIRNEMKGMTKRWHGTEEG